jgi:hypothetical protein
MKLKEEKMQEERFDKNLLRYTMASFVLQIDFLLAYISMKGLDIEDMY